MPERWRSNAERKLARAVRKAGGDVERVGVGKIKVTGPRGSVTVYEPANDTRPDLQRDSVVKLITEETGLKLE